MLTFWFGLTALALALFRVQSSVSLQKCLRRQTFITQRDLSLQKITKRIGAMGQI